MNEDIVTKLLQTYKPLSVKKKDSVAFLGLKFLEVNTKRVLKAKSKKTFPTVIDGKNGSDEMTNSELDSELVTFDLLIYPEHDIFCKPFYAKRACKIQTAQNGYMK